MHAKPSPQAEFFLRRLLKAQHVEEGVKGRGKRRGRRRRRRRGE
jgi:hypothetical protein